MGKIPLKDHFLNTYTKHADALMRFCIWKTSNRETSLDIVQDTFMRYWDTLSKGVVVENDKALLYTIARRLVIDHYRKKKTLSIEARAEMFDEDPFETPDEQAFGSIEIGSEARLIRDKIKNLDPEYRQPVYLRFIEDLSPKEIAEILSITPNLVSVRIDRGMKALRQLMNTKN